MARIVWDKVGERIFEAGVDHGVLYTTNGEGVAWNGLISVDESPSSGDVTPYYIDGVRYVNVADRHEFSGKIEAYTYPEEFAQHDGWSFLDTGIAVDEQDRSEFGLSYRTKVGNDIDGIDHGYKIHVIYNALATPTPKDYVTDDQNVEAMTFSWSFTTIPVEVEGHAPSSHIVIDSTKAKSDVMRRFENMLYGTSSVAPKLPSLPEVVKLFDDWSAFQIIPETTTGMASLNSQGFSDLAGNTDTGIFTIGKDSRLKKTSIPGLYSLD